MTKVNPNNGNETKTDFFPWNIFRSDIIFFLSKIIKIFNDFQNQNFSALWLKRNQTMEIKQGAIFFSGTGSDVMQFFYLTKNTKVCKWLSRSKFLKVNLNNENEAKSDNFPWDIFKPNIICF